MYLLVALLVSICISNTLSYPTKLHFRNKLASLLPQNSWGAVDGWTGHSSDVSTKIDEEISETIDEIHENFMKKTSLHQHSWGVVDDWNGLSSDIDDNVRISDSSYLEFEAFSKNLGKEMSEEEKQLAGNIDIIHKNVLKDEYSDRSYFIDTVSNDKSNKNQILPEENEMDEIIKLVRCNQSPDDILIREGRALKPLNDAERLDLSQLATPLSMNTAETKTKPKFIVNNKHFQSTEFFDNSISQIFSTYAIMNDKYEYILDASALSAWLSVCFNEHVGKYNKDILFLISKYGTYGSGYLIKNEFHQLYLEALQRALNESRLDQVSKTASALWNDFYSHGIISPSEAMHCSLETAMMEKMSQIIDEKNGQHSFHDLDIMDECEILDWGEDGQEGVMPSSHELVELASDNKTPKRIREGKFVFIDEETCIGCTQCVQVAPSSFLMLENGRARAFQQNSLPEIETAVSVCPVKCIHNCGFQELKKLEIARDEGDGLPYAPKRKHTPLHVAGIDSDANHVSSWYHQMKQRCSCPDEGCYDCPKYKHAGDNPHYKEIAAKAEKVRKLDLSLSSCHHLRKTAEL